MTTEILTVTFEPEPGTSLESVASAIEACEPTVTFEQAKEWARQGTFQTMPRFRRNVEVFLKPFTASLKIHEGQGQPHEPS